MRLSILTLFVILAMATSGCAFRGIPAHSGGKRFYTEQEVLAVTARKAISDISWDAVRGKKVALFISAMGDEGGSVPGDGSFGLSGLFGGDAMGQPAGGGHSAFYTSTQLYGPRSFAHAGDVEYLRGAVMEAIFAAGGDVARSDDKIDGDVFLVLDNFGTDRSKTSYVIFSETKLSAQIRMSAYYAPRSGGYTNLGTTAHRFQYLEQYVLFRILVSTGAIEAESIPEAPY